MEVSFRAAGLGLAVFRHGTRGVIEAEVFEEVALSERFVEFLTLPASARVDL